MSLAGLELPDADADAGSVVVDDRHLRRRVGGVGGGDPVDGVVGPERLPARVVVLVRQPRLAVDELLDLAEQLDVDRAHGHAPFSISER